MIDPSSPFAGFAKPTKTRTGRIYVNHCPNCHYIWKAPAVAERCLNCTHGEGIIECLTEYEAEIPIT